jgi:Skp family chaperone for outer membrane proteins
LESPIAHSTDLSSNHNSNNQDIIKATSNSKGSTSSSKAKTVLGKRIKPEFEDSEPEIGNKRLKTDSKSDQKKQTGKQNGKGQQKKEVDVKKEEFKETSRRSARNIGKEMNYNIDKILDAVDEANNVACGGGGIQVMLA